MGLVANWGSMGKEGQQDDSKEYGPLPEGIYLCSVEDVTQKPWTAKDGKAYGKWEIKLIIDNGPAKKGLHLYDWLYLSPSSIWKVNYFAVYCGLALKDGDELETFHLRGLPIGVEVIHEEYQGKIKERIKRYIRADEIAQEQAQSVQAKKPLEKILDDSQVPF